MFVKLEDLPKELAPEQLVLFDPSLFRPLVWADGPENALKNFYNNSIINGIMEGKINNTATAEDLQELVPRMFKVDDISLVNKFKEWYGNIYYNQFLTIYTAPRADSSFVRKVNRALWAYPLKYGKVELVARSIYCGIPKIVTDSFDLKRAEPDIQKIYNEEHPFPRQNVRIMDFKECHYFYGLNKFDSSYKLFSRL